jgi:hypothetical protein
VLKGVASDCEVPEADANAMRCESSVLGSERVGIGGVGVVSRSRASVGAQSFVSSRTGVVGAIKRLAGLLMLFLTSSHRSLVQLSRIPPITRPAIENSSNRRFQSLRLTLSSRFPR